MAWNIVEKNTERVEDTDPNVWVKSSEESLKNKDVEEALYKLDKAISYSNENSYYIFEKVKVLYSCKRYYECLQLIKNKIKNFKRDFYENDKLNELFEYYKGCIDVNLQNVENLYNNLEFLYDNERYEDCLETTEKNMSKLKENYHTKYGEKIIYYFDKCINILKHKDRYLYLDKTMLLYKYKLYEQFLNSIFNNMCNEFKYINKATLVKLLDCVNDALNNIESKNKYYIIKVKLFFYCNMYDECVDEIIENIDYLKTHHKKYISEYLEKCFINNNIDDTDLFKKILILFNINEFERFADIIEAKIDNFECNLNEYEFEQLLQKFYKAVTGCCYKSIEKIYEYMLILHKYGKKNEFIHILENKTNYDFIPFIRKDIEYYKQSLSSKLFDKLIMYFYNRTKCLGDGSDYYKFNNIKLLYDYEKYDECIELFKENIDNFSNKLKKEDYVKALKYFKNCYFKSEKILKGIIFSVCSPFKYRRKITLSITTGLFIFILLGYKYNLLYNIGILKPEIIGVQAAPSKKIIDKNEKTSCSIKVITKPKNLKRVKLDVICNNGNIVKVEKVDGLTCKIDGVEEGKAKLTVTAYGKNYKKDNFQIEVKRSVVEEIKIKVDKTKLKVNEKEKIETILKMNYENARKPIEKYTSSNPNIIEVDDLGHIRAVAHGQTEITVQAGTKKATVFMNVEDIDKSELEYPEFEYNNSNKINEKYDSYNTEDGNYNNNFIFKNSDVEKLRGTDLYRLEIWQLGIARNEIFARHGYVFKSSMLQNYFDSKDWYRKDYSYDGITLNSIEYYNANIIKEIEEIKIAYRENDNYLNQDYIFADSSSRKLSLQEIEVLNDWEIILARNEIFARRGFVFGITELDDYFKSRSWYHPDPNCKGNIENNIEDYNIRLIKKVEEERITRMFKREYGEV